MSTHKNISIQFVKRFCRSLAAIVSQEHLAETLIYTLEGNATSEFNENSSRIYLKDSESFVIVFLWNIGLAIKV